MEATSNIYCEIAQELEIIALLGSSLLGPSSYTRSKFSKRPIESQALCTSIGALLCNFIYTSPKKVLCPGAWSEHWRHAVLRFHSVRRECLGRNNSRVNGRWFFMTEDTTKERFRCYSNGWKEVLSLLRLIPLRVDSLSKLIGCKVSRNDSGPSQACVNNPLSWNFTNSIRD